MFEDIAPDYREKTVTIEPFPCLDTPLQMASVHPCKHAETMKRIFDGMARRKARREAEAAGIKDLAAAAEAGEAGEAGPDAPAPTSATTTTTTASTASTATATTTASPVEPGSTEDWEQVAAEDEDGLRVDQYLVVFVKFMAGVMPGVEMDYTMGI